jgi:hypothetical protein
MFDPKSVHVGFVVDKVALRQIFHLVVLSLCLRINPPVFHMQIAFTLAVLTFVNKRNSLSLSLSYTRTSRGMFFFEEMAVAH